MGAEPSTFRPASVQRSESDGWGNADVGGAWTSLGTPASAYLVDQGHGTHQMAGPGTLRRSYLNDVAAGDIDVTADVSFDQEPTGGGTYATLVVRGDDPNSYKAEVWAEANRSRLYLSRTVSNTNTLLESSGIIAGLVYEAGDTWRMRLQATGTDPTTLRAKIWNTQDPEPVDWTITTTDATPVLQDPGAIGVRSYLSSSAGTAQQVHYDNLTATDPSGAPAYTVTSQPGTTTGGGPVTTTYTWDRSGGLPLLLQQHSDTHGTTQLIYGPTGTVIEQIQPDGSVLFSHHDQLGSTRLLTDDSGDVVGTFSYDAYGATAATTGDTAPLLGFAGQYTDAETGFQYLRARYYDPTTGQFLTRDPLASITREPYAYAGNNPLNATDPTGLDTCGRPQGALGLLGSLVDCVANPTDLVDQNVDTAKQVVDTVRDHPGASATVAATAWCFVPAVGWASCAWAQGGALGVRSAEAARADGWDAAQGIMADAILTYVTAGLFGWAFDDLGRYAGRPIPAGYDMTMLWDMCFGDG